MDNGFDGIYATSIEFDMGGSYRDHAAELRAYGRNASTTVDGVKISGGYAVKLFSFDSSGNRSEVATLSPTVNSTLNDGSGKFAYLDSDYLQENDTMFEIQAGGCG
jgi:hypothetical protein